MTARSDVQALIDTLPTSIPPGTFGHRDHSQTYKQVYQGLLDLDGGGGGGGSDDGGLSLTGYITPGSGVDQTAGIQSCIADATSGGYSHVKPIFSVHPMEIHGQLQFGEMEYRGFGDQQAGSGFKCMSADAGLLFGDIDNGYQGSWSGGFLVDANNVAVTPLICGVKISWTLQFVTVSNVAAAGDFNDGAGIWEKGTQNSLFQVVRIAGGNAAWRLDGGADTNLHVKCEVNLGVTCNLDSCSETHIPGVFDVPGWNVFDTTIFEYDTGAQEHAVWSRSGNQNHLRDCVVYLLLGDSSTITSMICAEDHYSKGAEASWLRVSGTTIGCDPVSTTKVAISATFPAIINVEDGNRFIGFNYGIQGLCTITGYQQFDQINTASIDEVTDFPLSPVQTVNWEIVNRRPDATSVFYSYLVDGEDYPRRYDVANAIFMGGGTANPTEYLGRQSTGQWRLAGAALLADSALVACTGLTTQVEAGDVFGVPGIILGPTNDAIIIRAGTGIVGVTKLGVGNSASATVPGSVVKKIEVFDASGTSLGFLPVYSSIT